MNLQQYRLFINEQREYFQENLQPGFNGTWDDSSWVESGWLASRSAKKIFNFSVIQRMKGMNNYIIDQDFQNFMKSVLVLSYRKSNSKASPQKLYAELLVLKRWYAELNEQSPTKYHPCCLSTLVLEKSFEILAQYSSKPNLPDHAGTYSRLQTMINFYGFTEQPLEFSQKLLYASSHNRTPKAKKTKALLEQFELDENEINKEKLISIRTFINIVSLINLCETHGEKISLNFLLLLIVTGFRSTEAILLKTDSLIKQPLINPSTNTQIELDGIKQYTLGIKYHGAKGAGFRTHWVEPLAANLVESIFNSVLELTKEYRAHLQYIRSKNCTNFLPKSIDDINENFVEIDDLIGTVFNIEHKTRRGRAGKRETVAKSLKHIKIFKEVDNGQEHNKYYLKSDINSYIQSIANYHSKHPIDYIFNYEGKIEKIAFEDLLFIHEFKSTALKQTLSSKTNILPLTVEQINRFFGNTESLSVFEKYSLLENETEYSKLSSHIPRHNINTFLALSGLSEHLQAMLMGRVDIKQNQYYQHLALKQQKVAASILDKNDIVLYSSEAPEVQSPLEMIKKDGIVAFSEDLNLESNLKMNLQSFDTKKEVANYIADSFFDEYFDDIAVSFNEMVQNSDKASAEALIERHAYLHPLPFGACMRDVAAHGCHKRLACQSGDICGNFALTNRKGELETLQNKMHTLSKNLKCMENIITNDLAYGEMLDSLRKKMMYLTQLQDKAVLRTTKLTKITIFPYGGDDQYEQLPTTLSELFAIEQQKIDAKEI